MAPGARCTAPTPPLRRALLAALSAAALPRPEAADAAWTGTCSAGSSSGACSSSAAPDASEPLTWRAAAYKDSRRHVYGGDVVSDAFAAVGFGPGPVDDGEDWDLLWTHYPQGKALRLAALPTRRGRLVSHCGYFVGAGQKCRFAGHLERVESALGRSAGGASSGKRRYLRTFQLHNLSEHEAWLRELRERPHQYWVVKTCAGGNSKGVTLVGGADDAQAQGARGTWAVAQEYVHRPLTSAGGRKFHVRLYLHVPRWSPIGVLLYRGGLVFRSHHAHRGAQPSQRRDIFSAVSGDVEPLSLSAIWEELGSSRAAEARAGLREVLAEVFGSALDESFGDASGLEDRGYACFDLFGVDVIFGEDLWPYVLEVNLGPNLWVDRQGESEEATLRAIKQPMVQQLAAWAAGRVRLGRRSPAPTLEDHIALETEALRDFDRIL